MAVLIEPSVVFLKPRGMERPEASWRWAWDCVVRAPMAVQQMRSPMYWGVMGSRSSVAVGISISTSWARNCLAMVRPVRMSDCWFRCGSRMRPFQPTLVRGFSK